MYNLIKWGFFSVSTFVLFHVTKYSSTSCSVIIEKGLTKKGTSQKIKNILVKYNLPYEIDVNIEETLEVINLDKKKLGNYLNVIILKEIGSSEIYKTTAEFFKK